MKTYWYVPVFLVALFAVYLGWEYLSWSVQRSIHYKIAYESKVQETIRATVKQECLK